MGLIWRGAICPVSAVISIAELAPAERGSFPRWVPNLSESKPVDYGPDSEWNQTIFNRHLHCAGMLKAGYLKTLKREDYVHANRMLRRMDARICRHDLRLSMDDYELRDWCKAKSRDCSLIVKKHNPENAETLIRAKLHCYGIPFKEDGELLESDLERFCCEMWWRRQVRKLQGRELDEIARSMRLVNAGGQIYTSNQTIFDRRKRQASNRALLSEMVATNQEGQQYTLAELSDLSVSNPEIRRSELMVRIAGFEQVADSMGLIGEFYTITCPSKFHPMLTSYETYTNQHGQKKKRFKGCYENPKYNGATVRDSQEYLCNLWSRIRAGLARRDIGIFGFRVAESHHDGCPHWHLLLFMARGDAGPCRALFREYALAEDGAEVGAARHRFTAERIDKAKGTAVGYLAKYISKNINGAGLEGESDLFGADAVSSSERVQAWASCHGIRQFQQIGGPCVGPWRELRRLAAEDCPESLEDYRAAADASDWAAYVMLMGGPFCGRDQSVKVARWHEVDTETGEMLDAPVSRYGEETAGKVVGLWHAGEVVCTRFYTWVVERIRGFGQILNREFLGSGANAPPWSPVNNCTG